MSTVAIVGLGEAGRLFANGFSSAGAIVRGYDPFVSLKGQEIDQFAELAPALRGADLIISCVGVGPAVRVAREICRSATTPAVFADFNTLSPQDKRSIGDLSSGTPLMFADVAVMAPVPREGHRTPLLASGAAASTLKLMLEPLGASIEVISATPGDAASLKLVRSVFMKGLAALVIESLEAAEALGSRAVVADQIARELSGDGEALLNRLVTGTRRHAPRRLLEVRAAADLLDDLDVPKTMTDATARALKSISDRSRPS